MEQGNVIIDWRLDMRRKAVTGELTEREQEILGLMAQGWTNAAICRELWLSPKTVESHVRSIFMKLGLKDGAQEHRRVAAVLAFIHVTARAAA